MELSELPFFPQDCETLPERITTIEDLLKDGAQISKFPEDGLIGFYGVKVVSSNAKEMATFLELSMGFEEIAYRGLETNSRKIASHVVRNGNIVFEIVNTLEPVNEEYVHYPMQSNPSFQYKMERSALIDDHCQSLKQYIMDIGQEYAERMTHDGFNYHQSMEHYINSVVHSHEFKDIISKYKTLVNNLTQFAENTLYDIFDIYSMQKFLTRHGEGINDILLEVVDVDATFEKAVQNGAYIIKPPKLYRDELGSVKSATIIIPYTDIRHTLIQKIDYTGPYLPNYGKPSEKEERFKVFTRSLPPVELNYIDHCVQNYDWYQMMPQAEFYAKIFGLHKFWSVDEQDVSTTNTALKSIVMASSNGKIKIPINEPARGKMKSQIEEFYDYNGGPGVQHIALRTYNIVEAVSSLKCRGIEFNTISSSYYDNLLKRLQNDQIELFEDIDELKELNILVDYDSGSKMKMKNNKFRCNYILQIFTKPLHDRPTLFIEIIQRHHHNGFGKGTFKGLFETVENEQRLRGTLTMVEEDESDNDSILLM